VLLHRCLYRAGHISFYQPIFDIFVFSMHFLELSFQREKLELLSPNIMSHSIFWQLFGLKASSTTTSDVVG